MMEVSMIPNDDMINEAMAEAVREAYADGAFRKVPCRACGEVTFFPDPREEFCVDCCVEHHKPGQHILAQRHFW
jgi:hypothetical protein